MEDDTDLDKKINALAVTSDHSDTATAHSTSSVSEPSLPSEEDCNLFVGDLARELTEGGLIHSLKQSYSHALFS